MKVVNLKPVLVSLLLVSLFSLAVISFGVRLADINEANQSIADDGLLNDYISSLNETLSKANTNVQAGQEALNSPLSLATGFFVLEALQGIWVVLVSVPITLYNLTIGLILTKIFGDSAFAVAIGIFGAILGLTIIFAVVTLISTGRGD